MRFAFTDDQLAFRDAVRDLLEKECTPGHVRDAWTNDTGRVPGLWEQLREMGVVGMLAPEDKGGLGLTMVDLVLILEETGRHAVPEPIVETAASGVPVFDRTDLTITIGHALVPWADTCDVIITADGRFDPATADARAARLCRRRPAPLRGARAVGTRERRRRGRVRTARVRDRGAAVRSHRSHARDDRRIREGTQAIRRPGRIVPGREAPPRGRARSRWSSRDRSCTGRRQRSTPRTSAWRWRKRPTPPW